MTDKEINNRVAEYMAAVKSTLEESGKGRNVDIISLDILSHHLKLWLQASECVAKMGVILESDRGNKSKNPAIDVANASLRQVLAILQDYGLTAISRKRLERGEQKADDEDAPLVEFFKGK